MPHTNRKKKSSSRSTGVDTQKNFSHSKREYIISEDGWTHVADKRWRSMTGKDRSSQILHNQSIDMTLDEMVKEYERYRQEWENSDACIQLKIILSSTKKEGRRPVENVICLGLGSLQALPLEWRRSSHTQLAALVTVRDSLGLGFQMTMQDPRFTDLDKSFLDSIGCTVVNNPEAFEHVTQTSLIYAIHCPLQLLWKVKHKADPALLIMNQLQDARHEQFRYNPEIQDETAIDLKEWQQTDEEKEQSYQNHYDEIYSLKKDCEDIAFPQLRNDFSDTMIYWRTSPGAIQCNDAISNAGV